MPPRDVPKRKRLKRSSSSSLPSDSDSDYASSKKSRKRSLLESLDDEDIEEVEEEEQARARPLVLRVAEDDDDDEVGGSSTGIEKVSEIEPLSGGAPVSRAQKRRRPKQASFIQVPSSHLVTDYMFLKHVSDDERNKIIAIDKKYCMLHSKYFRLMLLPGANKQLFKEWLQPEDGIFLKQETPLTYAFRDSAELKALGASYDKTMKRFLLPPCVDIRPFKKHIRNYHLLAKEEACEGQPLMMQTSYVNLLPGLSGDFEEQVGLGAQWNKDLKANQVPPRLDLRPFKRWLANYDDLIFQALDEEAELNARLREEREERDDIRREMGLGVTGVGAIRKSAAVTAAASAPSRRAYGEAKRIYLSVFGQSDQQQCKLRGGQFDWNEKRWFVTQASGDLAPFREWMAKASSAHCINDE